MRRTPTKRGRDTVGMRHDAELEGELRSRAYEAELRSRVYEAGGGGAEDCIPMIRYRSCATAVIKCTCISICR